MIDIVETIQQKNPNDTVGILDAALDHYGDKIALAMSFQVGGAVLLDMIHHMGREVDVFSIDTGRLPEETYDCAHQITEKYGIKIKWVFPQYDAVENMIQEKGIYSFRHSVENRKECCGIRKVEPLTRALAPYDAWLTGRRLEQGGTRHALDMVEPDPKHEDKIKINPLVKWTVGDLWRYIREHDVPYNQLYDEGYRSIGCECCTRACKGGEGERDGRWWWEEPEHKECGLHISYTNGSGI